MASVFDFLFGNPDAYSTSGSNADTGSQAVGGQTYYENDGSSSVSSYFQVAAETGAFGSDSPLVAFVPNKNVFFENDGSQSNSYYSTDDVKKGAADTSGFFDKLKDSIGKAYDKDPMKALELGFGTLAGLYKSSEARRLQQAQSQSAMDQINQRYANEKDAQDRYTASLRGGNPRASTRKALTRNDGIRVYNANGTLNRG